MKKKKVILLSVLMGLIVFSIFFSTFIGTGRAIESPQGFTLRDNTGRIEEDGSVKLSWEISLYAEKYILYQSDQEITDISNAEKKGEFNYRSLSTTLTYDEQDNGTYYYVIVAQNEHGTEMSNNVNFEVKVPPLPESFKVKSNKKVSRDGKFILNWSRSRYADNYEVYRSTVKLNTTEDLRYGKKVGSTENTTIQLSNKNNGKYYYVVLAKNERAEILSENSIKISIETGVDFTPILESIDPVLLFSILGWSFCFMFIFFWRVRYKPVFDVLNAEDFKEEKLGRYVDQRKAEHLNNFYILSFKHNTKGIREYYCRLSWDQIQDYIFGSKYVYEKYTAELIHRTQKVKDLTFIKIPEKRLVDTPANKILYYLYRALSIIPSNVFAKYLHSKLEFEETGEYKEEIELLQLRILMKKLTTVHDIEYKKKTLNMKNEKGTELVKKQEVPHYYLEEIKNSEEYVKDSLEIKKTYVKTTQIQDVIDAINEQKSMDELRSLHNLQMSYQMKKFDELSQKHTHLLEIHRQLQNEFQVKLAEKIEEVMKKGKIEHDDFTDLLAKAYTFKELKGDPKTVIKGIVEEYFDKKEYKKYRDIAQRNERLQGENEMLKAQIDKLWKMLPNHKKEQENDILLIGDDTRE